MEQQNQLNELVHSQEWSGDLVKLLFEGRAQETFNILKTDKKPEGHVVILRTLDVGEEERVQAQCSGLDIIARQHRFRLYSMVYALVSIDGYTFGTGDPSLKERLEFISNLQPTVFEFLAGLYFDLQDKTTARVKESLDGIKKSQPDQSPESSGD